MQADDVVEIFTDGSCLGNPGPGGWAALLRCGERSLELSGGFRLTTNNRMELMAALEGLARLKRDCSVTLYTDSRYLSEAVNKGWLEAWRGRGWKKADKKEVLNRDLWERLLPLLERHRPRLAWVAGHRGHPENERVDALARAAAGAALLPPDPGFCQTCRDSGGGSI
ncbi:MAG: ribonuclease HI [Deltaproteobacteria bacterium]|jgi:ribonuclease HI|nr:ribonuclease HI [Deltaproteobacteria bacterium]